MRVYVNNSPVDLLPGMTVWHALVKADLLKDADESKAVCDEWGNVIGLDGALTEGMKIFLRKSRDQV